MAPSMLRYRSPRRWSSLPLAQVLRLSSQARQLSLAALHWSNAVFPRLVQRRRHKRRAALQKRKLASGSRGHDKEMEQSRCLQLPSAAVDCDREVITIKPSQSIAASNDRTSWIYPDDFFSLAFGAGLRSDDSTWMDEFNKACEERLLAAKESVTAPVERVCSDLFVRIVMDDLVRHCQNTRDSLQDMLRVLQVTDASQEGSDCLEAEILADDYDAATLNVKACEPVSEIIGLHGGLHDSVGLANETDIKASNPSTHTSDLAMKDDVWQPLAFSQLSQLPRRLQRVAEESSKDRDMPFVEVDRSPERLCVWHPKKVDDIFSSAVDCRQVDIPMKFDPIPEVRGEADPGKTDWCSALQDVFIA